RKRFQLAPLGIAEGAIRPVSIRDEVYTLHLFDMTDVFDEQVFVESHFWHCSHSDKSQTAKTNTAVSTTDAHAIHVGSCFPAWKHCSHKATRLGLLSASQNRHLIFIVFLTQTRYVPRAA